MPTLATLLFLLTQAAGSAPIVDAPPRPSSSSWSAEDVQVLADERASLRGISRLAVAVDVPAELAAALPAAPLQATAVFRLEQAGLSVVARRELEDPLLSIAIEPIVDSGAPAGAPPVAYRVSADLMQLVRLKDDARHARFTQASTWQVADPGVVRPSDVDRLRDRIAALVDLFLADRDTAGRGQPARPDFTLP